MTKRINWRLKEQPTTENLRELVKDGILTKEEAREILMNYSDDEPRQSGETGRTKESLEEEIVFLRKLVDSLSKDRTTVITRIKEIQSPWYYDRPWYKPYEIMCSNTATYNNLSSIGMTNGGLTTARFGQAETNATINL